MIEYAFWFCGVRVTSSWVWDPRWTPAVPETPSRVFRFCNSGPSRTLAASSPAAALCSLPSTQALRSKSPESPLFTACCIFCISRKIIIVKHGKYVMTTALEKTQRPALSHVENHSSVYSTSSVHYCEIFLWLDGHVKLWSSVSPCRRSWGSWLPHRINQQSGTAGS